MDTMMTYNTPKGYNPHDYKKVRAFLEQTDNEGRKNGDKLSYNYDPNDPTTWGTYGGKYLSSQRFKWIEFNGELRIQSIYVAGCEICGTLDVSGCTALEDLYCYLNNLTTLDVSGCIALEDLDCWSNNLTTLDVSSNTALKALYCGSNNLTMLDVSNNTALRYLDCSSNNLTGLDVSSNTALKDLYCDSNNLTTLDVSGCTALKALYCGSNNLTELDLGSCPQMHCFCDDNVRLSNIADKAT